MAGNIVIRRIWKSTLIAGEMELSICGTTNAAELQDVLTVLELAAKQIKRDYLNQENEHGG